jgi:mono/diheme cytochrome c family protein
VKKVMFIAATLFVAATVSTTTQSQLSRPAPQAPVSPKPTATSSGTPSATADSLRATHPDVPGNYQVMVTKYCVGCHNTRNPLPAGAPLALDKANFAEPGADAATWERVIKKLGVGAMPPQGSPTPGAAELGRFRTSLVASLDAAAAKRTSPGKYVLHRLNRTEYANAVRDLLGVTVDVADLLPSDAGEFGFDNIATALPTSPLLLERYLAAGLRIAELAVGDASAEPGTHTYTISTVVTQTQHVEGLPLGTRGGMLVRHNFVADGDYVFSGRLLKTVAEGLVGVEGHETPHHFVVTLDAKKVFSAPIGGKDDHDRATENKPVAREEFDRRMMSPRIRVTAGFHEVGFTFIERPTQEQNFWQPVLRSSQEAHNPSGLPRLRNGIIEGPYGANGVTDSASRAKVFVCTPASATGFGGAGPASATGSGGASRSSRRSSPDIAASEGGCADQILSTIARRAFRRPVTKADMESPLALYREERAAGGDFDAGIRVGLARILTSPSFLFRSEQDPATLPVGAAHRVSDLELASRLSFFLWSSIPDDELLNVAIAGRLRAPGVLEAQMRRMIADPRADALMTAFTGQWLQLRNLDKVTPDVLLFPDFDDNVRQAMRRETELLFASIVRENRPALTLLEADYTFVNERLARHYGISGVYGSRFRRVPVTDPNRRGLLGHASILSMTAVANRTSPVLRGKYIISNLLNTPPLPPPAVVPDLEESAQKDKPTTVREQLERHRANPACGSCHRNIDPVGFALENFDAVGQWRSETREGLALDAAGVLSDGSQVDGPVALRKALLSRPEVFVGTVTEKLLIYALGRGLEPIDMPVVRSVARNAAAQKYAMQSILLGIVKSDPFQMRTKLTDTGSAPASITAAADARERVAKE